MTPDLIIEKLAGSFERPSGRLRPGADVRERGDYDLNPGYRPTGALTPAAVLVPLITHAGGMTVLLTQRTVIGCYPLAVVGLLAILDLINQITNKQRMI